MAAGKTTRTRSVEGDADKEMRCQGNVISELKVENLLYIEHLARPNRHISHYSRTKLKKNGDRLRFHF